MNLTNLTATNVASGTLALARGGTGAGTASAARTALGLAAGIYTPTGTTGSNVSAVTPAQAQYIQIGSVVFVTGRVSATATQGSAAVFYLSLPVASDLTTSDDLAGLLAESSNGAAGMATGIIDADTTNNRAQITLPSASGGGAQNMYFHFSYEVI